MAEKELKYMTAEEIEAVMKEGLARRQQDDEDRRTKRGKYTPPTGICRVCQGKVVAEIAYDNGGRIGGPPVPGHVAGWHCESCFIVYRRCPVAAEVSGNNVSEEALARGLSDA